MNAFTAFVAAGSIAILAGCGHDEPAAVAQPPPAPPVADAPPNFTTLVASQITVAGFSDATAQPLPIDTLAFTFPDEDNPNAFNAAIAAAP